MGKIRSKMVAMVVVVFFLHSCIKTTTYLAPNEGAKVSAAKKIIIEMKDGTELELKNVRTEKEKLIGHTQQNEKKEIEFSSIESVRIEKVNRTYAYLFGLAGAVAAGLIIGATTAPAPPPSECCPFIYSFDGKRYVFDAEPYGGAICQGLQRADWCGLEYPRTVDGQYRLLVSNELKETQYIDELKLYVVDHPLGITVVPDNLGRMHTILDPVLPFRAVDKRGTSLWPLISQKDGIPWKAGLDFKNPGSDGNLRDELVFEFHRPLGATKAKLWINATTTLWGSQVARRFLSLFGASLSGWYRDVNSHGPAYYQIMNWFVREELYLLKIRVETPDGWKTKGIIYGGGPFASKDKAYALDISDAPGDILRIKLAPPLGFWSIDSLALDFGEDAALDVAEISPIQAINHKGQDVRDLLASDDGRYLILPNIGDSTEVAFSSPPQKEGTERSVFLKAVGHYKIGLEAKGDARDRIISRIFTEPGYTLRFSLSEYQKSTKGNTRR